MQIKRGSFSDPKDPRLFKHYDFNKDPEIPVVLVFPVRKWRGHFEVLFMRRGFKVGAYRGWWTPIAGVDDHVVALNEDGQYDDEAGSLASCVDELKEEAGIIVGPWDLVQIGEQSRQCLEKADRTWLQKLYVLRYYPIETVVLNWENIGAMWVPIASVAYYVRCGRANTDEMQTVISDGTPMIEEGTLAIFADYCREHELV